LQVERYSFVADKMPEEDNLFPKHYAKTVIKDTESYLNKVEKLFFQRKKELIKDTIRDEGMRGY